MKSRKHNGNGSSAACLKLVLLVTLTILTSTCNITGPDLDTVGTVGFWDGEGGCWSISTSKENLHPLDLPDEFSGHAARSLRSRPFAGDLSECSRG